VRSVAYSARRFDTVLASSSLLQDMDISKQGETSGFQFLIVALACQGERPGSMRQGIRWIVPTYWR